MKFFHLLARISRLRAIAIPAFILLAVAAQPAQAVITEILQRGQTGEPVRLLQQALIRRGYLDASLDTGVFGALTEAAIIQFQGEQGLAPDGVVGGATLDALGLSGRAAAGRAVAGRVVSGRGGDFSGGLNRSEVQALQARLVALNFDPGPVDGVVGPQTERAIADFQRSSGQAVNPVVSVAILNQVTRVYEDQLRFGTIRSVEDLELPLPAASDNGPIARVTIPRAEADDFRGSSFPSSRGSDPVNFGERPFERGRSVGANVPPFPQSDARRFDSSEFDSSSFDSPYVIAIPGDSFGLLDAVQTYVPSAFPAENRRGRYIQAGAFPSRGEAEAEERFLRSKGLDARVIFLP